jgi:hypothetical protein
MFTPSPFQQKALLVLTSGNFEGFNLRRGNCKNWVMTMNNGCSCNKVSSLHSIALHCIRFHVTVNFRCHLLNRSSCSQDQIRDTFKTLDKKNNISLIFDWCNILNSYHQKLWYLMNILFTYNSIYFRQITPDNLQSWFHGPLHSN